MHKQISVLLADISGEYLRSLAERVEKEEDLVVVGATQDGEELYDMASRLRPDCLVTDILLKGHDGMGMLRRLRDECRLPGTIVVSAFLNTGVLSELSALGIEYCFIKPCQPDELFERIRSGSRARDALLMDTCEELISSALMSCGVMPHLRGFNYLREGIKRCMTDRESLRVTKILYPELGRQFGTNAGSVERSIRSAMEAAWKRCDVQQRRLYFGDEAQFLEKRPANGAFMAFIAEFVSNQQRKLMTRQ